MASPPSSSSDDHHSLSLTIEQAKAYLMECSSGDRNLHEHLVRLVSTIVLEKPVNAYDIFEDLSRYVKESVTISKGIPTTEDEEKCGTSAEEKDPYREDIRAQWFSSMKAALAISTATTKTSDHPMPDVPDMPQEGEILQYTGVGMSSCEIYQIFSSLKILASKTQGLHYIRFWGKILGTEKDYYILEGQLSGYDVNNETDGIATPDEEIEERGTGANSHTYWVASDASLSDWIMLPDVVPSHIVIARKIKKLLTGHLDHVIISHPWFPATERHYLRTILAIISSETTICPVDYYQLNEQTNGYELNPVFVMPALEELANLKSWTHCREAISKTGRTMNPEIDAESDPQLAANLEIEEENKPLRHFLQPLSDDDKSSSFEDPWIIRIEGDINEYGEANICFGVVVVKSTLWQGAVTAVRGTSVASIYVGYGLPSGQVPFFPTAPGPVQEDPKEVTEQPEPQPFEEDQISDGGSQEEEDPAIDPVQN